MRTETIFPVESGSIVSVECFKGFELSGDSTLQCSGGNSFQFLTEPTCGEREIVLNTG